MFIFTVYLEISADVYRQDYFRAACPSIFEGSQGEMVIFAKVDHYDARSFVNKPFIEN